MTPKEEFGLESIKRVLSKFNVSKDKQQLGEWGRFAEPNEVLDFINHLSK